MRYINVSIPVKCIFIFEKLFIIVLFIIVMSNTMKLVKCLLRSKTFTMSYESPDISQTSFWLPADFIYVIPYCWITLYVACMISGICYCHCNCHCHTAVASCLEYNYSHPLLYSVKCFPGEQKIHFIPSISKIQSHIWYYCVQYTRRHLMSLNSHF